MSVKLRLDCIEKLLHCGATIFFWCNREERYVRATIKNTLRQSHRQLFILCEAQTDLKKTEMRLLDIDRDTWVLDAEDTRTKVEKINSIRDQAEELEEDLFQICRDYDEEYLEEFEKLHELE